VPPVLIGVHEREGVIATGEHDGVEMRFAVVVLGVRGGLAVVDAPADLLAVLDDMDVDVDGWVAVWSQVRSHRAVVINVDAIR
jgi:hypothetical protein